MSNLLDTPQKESTNLQRKWIISPSSPEKASVLKNEINVSSSICEILVQRGIDNHAAAKQYFRPCLSTLHAPALMKDITKAVDRIQKAMEQKEKILIFGDYDVDGTTAVSLVYAALAQVYPKELLDFYIPHRYREGYGLSQAGIDFADSHGFGLIICLDCGIKSVELVAYAAEKNVDIIICDHHIPGGELPKAIAILNPKQNDCAYPYKELCGCGIGYKLMQAVYERLKIEVSELYKYHCLLATAIAADIVPITGENRVFAYHGVQQINKQPPASIAALLKLAAAQLPLTISTLVFVLAPRINAAGRMDDARKVINLLIEKDEEKALELAGFLHSDNTERKEVDKSITEEALEIISKDQEQRHKKANVVFKDTWHKGVVGIVASRIIENYYKPTIVLTLSNGLITGSARTVDGFNLYEAIHACRKYLTAYGGHFAAAGLSMQPEHYKDFKQAFENEVAATITEDALIPKLKINAEIKLNQITPNFYNVIKQMEPFGPENMRPVFMAKNVTDNGYSKIVKENHIRFVITNGEQSISGIGFNMSEKFQLLKKPFDIVFTLDENAWNDTTTIQLKVLDIRANS